MSYCTSKNIEIVREKSLKILVLEKCYLEIEH